MNTIELLDKLQRQAMSDEKLRKELLETRKASVKNAGNWAMRSTRWNWSLRGKSFTRK